MTPTPRPVLAIALLAVSAATAVAGDLEDKLWAACRKGDVPEVERHVAAGADVNARSHYGANAMWFAAYKDHTAVARALLAHKADVNARDSVWGETPLSMAVEHGP